LLLNGDNTGHAGEAKEGKRERTRIKFQISHCILSLPCITESRKQNKSKEMNHDRGSRKQGLTNKTSLERHKIIPKTRKGKGKIYTIFSFCFF